MLVLGAEVLFLHLSLPCMGLVFKEHLEFESYFLPYCLLMETEGSSRGIDRYAFLNTCRGALLLAKQCCLFFGFAEEKS